jgi:hypothetical protein
MNGRGALLFGLCALLGSSVAFADSPPLPPADWDLDSENGRFVAHGDVGANKIVVQQKTERGMRPLWEIKPWQNPMGFVLSNDGQGMAHFEEIGFRSGLDQKILTFFYRGVIGHAWYLRDFFKETESLPRSVSHMQWTTNYHWSDQRFAVKTVDGRILVFDEATGELRN